MISYNWLYHYHSRQGIEKAIMGLVKRIPRLGDADEILFALFNNIEILRPHYQTFIQDVTAWSSDTLKQYEL
jgi:acyl carrier protein phosphodiesterase